MITLIQSVIIIVVESALLYTWVWHNAKRPVRNADRYHISCATLATFVSYLAKSNLQFPGLDSVCYSLSMTIKSVTHAIELFSQTSPVIGIVFCLIIIRVSMGIGHRGIASSNGASQFAGKGTESRPQTYPLRSLTVNITQQVHSTIDPYSESSKDVSSETSRYCLYITPHPGKLQADSLHPNRDPIKGQYPDVWEKHQHFLSRAAGLPILHSYDPYLILFTVIHSDIVLSVSPGLFIL